VLAEGSRAVNRGRSSLTLTTQRVRNADGVLVDADVP